MEYVVIYELGFLLNKTEKRISTRKRSEITTCSISKKKKEVLHYQSEHC